MDRTALEGFGTNTGNGVSTDLGQHGQVGEKGTVL